MGKLSSEGASRTIDVSGLYVAPGFIDLHSHADWGLSDPYLAGAGSNLAQGITTVVVGQDGRHAWPLGGSFSRQVALWQRQGIGNNIIPLVGQGSARYEVMGFGKEPATAEQRKAIAARISSLLEAGAWGLSSGLSYEPGVFSPPEEVVEAARPLAKFGGFYISHMRDQGDKLIPAIEETIDVGRQIGVRVVVTHIKSGGKANWGKSAQAVAVMKEARARGLEVYGDLYPYETPAEGIDVTFVPLTAIFSPDELRELATPFALKRAEAIQLAVRVNPTLQYFVDPDFLRKLPESRRADALGKPQWLERQPIYRRRIRNLLYDDSKSKTILSTAERLISLSGGGGELVEVSYHPDERFTGKRLSDLAKQYGVTEARAAVELTLQGAKFTQFAFSEDDIVRFIQQPFIAGGSDGILPEYGDGYTHPRSYGTFARRIRRYVYDLGVIDLPFAIRTATALAAEIVGLTDRGVIEKGRWADIIVFDPKRIRDYSTYQRPHRWSDGIDWVLVNGEIELENGDTTDRRAGRVLLKREVQKEGGAR